jgi:hypothetical protein
MQDLAKVVYELCVVNLAEACRVLGKLGNRLRQLGTSTVQVSMMEVVQANGGLNETLIEKAQGALGYPPQILPRLVGLEVVAGIEKIYSFGKEIGHRTDLAKLLRDMAQIATIACEETTHDTRWVDAHQLYSSRAVRTDTLFLQRRLQSV